MLADDDKVTILADDLTGAADVCAPLAGTSEPGLVCLSTTAKIGNRRLVSFDGNMRMLPDDLARQTIAQFVRGLKTHDRLGGVVWLKIDSATRGHIARDVTLLLNNLNQFRGAVIAPAFPAMGRLFQDDRAIFADGRNPAPSLREQFEAAGETVTTLSDLTGDTAAIGQRIDAALSGSARIILVETSRQDDLVRLAPALLARRRDVLGVSSGGLIEAIAGGGGAAPGLTPSRLTCLFGTQSRVSRAQIESLEKIGGAVRVSRTPAQWREPAISDLPQAVSRALQTRSDRIFDICGDAEIKPPESPSISLARVMAPLMTELDTVLMSGGDTARALLENLGLESFDVVGVFEHGIPICTVASLPNPFLLKSGGFGDPETLLRLAAAISQTEKII